MNYNEGQALKLLRVGSGMQTLNSAKVKRKLFAMS